MVFVTFPDGLWAYPLFLLGLVLMVGIYAWRIVSAVVEQRRVEHLLRKRLARRYARAARTD